MKQENNDISKQLEHRDGIISSLESKIAELHQTIQQKDKTLHEKSIVEANLEASKSKLKNLEGQNEELKAGLAENTKIVEQLNLDLKNSQLKISE